MNMVLCANSDAGLEPHTTYEYRVSVWNRRGHGLSSPSWVTTKEDAPQGVLPPHWSRVGLRDDVILLNWSSPIKPNGNSYLFFFYRVFFVVVEYIVKVTKKKDWNWNSTLSVRFLTKETVNLAFVSHRCFTQSWASRSRRSCLIHLITELLVLLIRDCVVIFYV